jgi:hypothetical protein
MLWNQSGSGREVPARLTELCRCQATKAKPVFEETLNQKGAMALARRLEQFWHAKGYFAARFWVEPIGERFDKVGTYEIYKVVCNLVNGLPPRYADPPLPLLPLDTLSNNPHLPPM